MQALTRQAPSILALALAAALAGKSARQEGHEGHSPEMMMPPEKLGTVHFPVSVKPGLQADFDRAVALLHSFQYEEAEKAFAAIAQADPELGMAYWGIAMCNYHPIWGPTTQADFERGRAAALKAAKVDARTERERDYIGAIGTYYASADRLDSATRRVAYQGAMEQLHTRHPDDIEGTIFYALAILGTAPATDKTYAKQRQAADLLNAVLPEAPDRSLLSPRPAHALPHLYAARTVDGVDSIESRLTRGRPAANGENAPRRDALRWASRDGLS